MCAAREVSPGDHNGDKPAAGPNCPVISTRRATHVTECRAALVAARHDNIDKLQDCFDNARMETVRVDRRSPEMHRLVPYR